MNIWIIFIIVTLVLGIILLSGKNVPAQRKSRENQLKEFAHFWEGTLKPLEGYEDSYWIAFKFGGRDFEFEDIQDKGFQETEYKGFLKTRTATDFTLGFTEAPRKSIKTDIVQASHIGEPFAETVAVPKELKAFSVFSNRPQWVNALFRDYRILDVFVSVKGSGGRAEPVMPLRVQNGTISLEFAASHTMKANLNDVRQSAAKLERFVAGLTTLAKAIEAEQAKNQN